MFYICLALDSSNWIKICLDWSSRILESCSLWLFSWWLWTSPVRHVCHIFCSFAMFEFLLKSGLFSFSFEYCWLSFLVFIVVVPGQFEQVLLNLSSFRASYRFIKPEKIGQTQRNQREILEVFFESLFSNLFVFWLCLFAQNKINSIYIHI